MPTLYASITNCSNILDVTVTASHASAVTTATVNCVNTTLDVGDSISIDIGFSTSHGKVFQGYVKQIDRNVPNNSYVITAHDVLTRAVDYFIVSSNPETPFTRSSIKAEFLVRDILQLAGLTNYGYTATSFTFATEVPLEINLVSAYDYCNSIAGLLTWHLYADYNGKVWFINRKPYVIHSGMPELSQPGVTTDSSIGTITDAETINITHRSSEKDVRNKVVVYGSTGVYATASSATTLDPESGSSSAVLPAGYYKSAAMATPIINSTSFAQTAANYNLLLFNRLTKQINISVLGNYTYMPRNVITIQNTILSINNDYYIYSAEHSWGKSGYIVGLELRR